MSLSRRTYCLLIFLIFKLPPFTKNSHLEENESLKLVPEALVFKFSVFANLNNFQVTIKRIILKI